MNEITESSEAKGLDAASLPSSSSSSATTTLTNVEPTDGELVARVCDGDDAAFEQLFNRHRRRVALIAGRFFYQREQVEEIVQESFTKAYFALNNFSGNQELSFASWLARIAFNVCYDELRRRKRQPEIGIGDFTENETSWIERARLQPNASSSLVSNGRGTADNVESKAVSRDLARKLLARLSPEDRLVLVMLDVEELSVAEIAALMKWSISKVKVRAHRARGSLRRILGKFL